MIIFRVIRLRNTVFGFSVDFLVYVFYPPLFLDKHPTKSYNSYTRGLLLVTSLTEGINIDNVL